jgi:hypothetical protein
LTFFQNPIGQAGKTANDTNMTLAGQLPAQQAFLITAVCIDFYPAAAIGRDGNAGVSANWNDTQILGEGGELNINIGSKNFLQQAPLGKFPTNFRQAGAAALTGESAATTISVIDYSKMGGSVFQVVPFTLIATQNFNVTLIWNTALPISDDARIGVIFQGFLTRASQ